MRPNDVTQARNQHHHDSNSKFCHSLVIALSLCDGPKLKGTYSTPSPGIRPAVSASLQHKMKQRFSSVDVRVIALELAATITSLRVSNIYDLSSRIFLLKLQKPGSKQQLLVDSGFRCHLTSFARTTAAEPSAFVRRLRKYLKSRRITGITQIGTDRVIEIDFSDGQYKLYLEFFAAGNIILTDAELNVLALLRQVSEGNEDVDVRVGGKYVLEAKQNYAGIPAVTESRAKEALKRAAERTRAAQEIGGKKAKRAKGGDDLRKALSAGFPEYPAHLLECAFSETAVDVSRSVASVLEDASKLDAVMQALKRAETIFQELEKGPWRGYIVAKLKESIEQSDGEQLPRDALLYDDFHPFRPKQFDGKKGLHILETDGFNAAVDDFYSSIESQKLSSRLTEREETAKRKLQSAKDEHDKRLGALQHVQEIHIRKAQAIETNTHRVEEACAAVNGLIGQGMDWININKLIENEQSRGNVVAMMIKLPLKLQENTVTLLLEEASFEDSESEEEDRTDSEAGDSDSDDSSVKKAKPKSEDNRLAVDVDLALSPWSNARQYYDQKKIAAVKEQKTLQASSKALKSTEQKIQADLKKGLKQEKEVLREVRPQFWFEKFLWFISSEGYLVLSGKDAPQSEILYQRYLRKGDVYVHADLQGASPVIVKNNPKTPDAVIPPGTLSQAGAFCVCGSSAWDSKAVMSAWWVAAEQTSRLHEATGELVKGGGVVVKGQKNWLPPSQLLLGFAIGWLISPESRKNHGKLRVENNVDDATGGVQELDLQGKEGTMPSVDEAVADKDNENEVDGGTEGVPDVEDAADVAEEDIEQDEADEAEAMEEAEDADALSIKGEADATASDVELDTRVNPLQSNNPDGPDSDLSSDDEDETTNIEDQHPQENDTPPTAHSTDPTSAPSTTTTTTQRRPLPRGKRTKARKAATKYAAQDDEDRALALSLLGSKPHIDKKAAEQAAREEREAKATADKARRLHNQQRAKAREEERARRLASVGGGEGGEGSVMPPEEQDSEELARERREHEDLDLIVPALAAGDEVVGAMVICAPWSALGRYKYKVKLQPGGLKKGKAVREILGGWQALGGVGGVGDGGKGKGGGVKVDETNSDRERVWRVEVEKMRGLREGEVQGQVMVKGVRVVQGGGLAGGGKAAGSSGKGGGKGGKSGGGGRGGKKR